MFVQSQPTKTHENKFQWVLTESVPCLTIASNRFGLGVSLFLKAGYFNYTSETNEETSTLDEDLEMQDCSARSLTPVKNNNKTSKPTPHS